MSRGLLYVMLFSCLPSSSWAQNSLPVVSAAESRGRRQVERGLETRVSFRFKDTPLDVALRELLQRAGISFTLDHKSLEELGIDVASPVTLGFENVTARTFLKTMLTDVDLTWMIHGELLTVTTFEEAEYQLETRIYPVSDLIQTVVGFRRAADYDTLIDTITRTLEPDSWDDVGGPGAIEAFPNAKALVISQTTEIHDRIERLITTLRRVRRAQGLPVLILPRDDPPVPEPTGPNKSVSLSRPESANPRATRTRRSALLYGVPLGD